MGVWFVIRRLVDISQQQTSCRKSWECDASVTFFRDAINFNLDWNLETMVYISSGNKNFSSILI